MAREVRFILFSDNEAIWALVQGRRNLGLAVADGTVRSFVTHVSNGHPEALLTIEPGAGRRLEEHVFAADEMRDALIGYCRSRAIPLPRDAAKEVELTRGRIGLVVTLDTAEDWPGRPAHGPSMPPPAARSTAA